MKGCRLLFPFMLTLVLTGCLGRPEPLLPVPKPPQDRTGLLGRVGTWLSKDPDKADSAEGGPGTLSPPIPQKMPIGSVHLVQESAGFVLIHSSRLAEVPATAELLTYDQGGKPTGKLRISPERKSGFLAADILEGHPRSGDRVVMFGYLDGQGQMQTQVTDPTATGEVLE